MLGRRSKNSAAAIRATTTHARLEALELTLLAVLPLLPPASRAIVRSSIAGFMDEDITTPPAGRARQGDGQLVLIVGEPGLGKSRLIEEFHTRLGETPHTWGRMELLAASAEHAPAPNH